MNEDAVFNWFLQAHLENLRFMNEELRAVLQGAKDPLPVYAPWIGSTEEVNACIDSMELQMMGIRPC